MALCVFALIASEFMPVSLLTPMAHDLRVSEGFAGMGIAISGAFAVLTSLSISVLAGSMNRKTLLLGLTALMAVICRGLVVRCEWLPEQLRGQRSRAVDRGLPDLVNRTLTGATCNLSHLQHKENFHDNEQPHKPQG